VELGTVEEFVNHRDRACHVLRQVVQAHIEWLSSHERRPACVEGEHMVGVAK